MEWNTAKKMAYGRRYHKVVKAVLSEQAQAEAGVEADGYVFIGRWESVGFRNRGEWSFMLAYGTPTSMGVAQVGEVELVVDVDVDESKYGELMRMYQHTNCFKDFS